MCGREARRRTEALDGDLGSGCKMSFNGLGGAGRRAHGIVIIASKDDNDRESS